MSKYCPECGVPDGVEEVLYTEADALRARIAELEAEVERLRQECADVVEVSTRWTVADLAMQRVVEAARTCGALRENVLMAPEYRSLRDAIRALDEQEERCVMVGCPLRGPHSHDGDAHDNRVSQ